MIILEDGLERCGRCICGWKVGYIIRVDQRTYTIRWRDGDTTQLRPDLDDDLVDLTEIPSQAAE